MRETTNMAKMVDATILLVEFGMPYEAPRLEVTVV